MTGDMSSDSPISPPAEAYDYHHPAFTDFSEDRALAIPQGLPYRLSSDTRSWSNNLSSEICNSSLNLEVNGNVPQRDTTYRIPHTVSLVPPLKYICPGYFVSEKRTLS